jgi:hypothetical protein
MKTNHLQKMLAVMAVAGLALSASTALAQDSTTVAQPAVASATVPQLSDSVAQIVQLAQAKISEGTIIAYIKNSGNSYRLDANQIIYLRQQGISDAVITTMLNQPRPAVAVATPTTPAPQPVASTANSGPVSTATVAPTVTYVQTVPDTTYYYQPDYQPYYYPAYAWYPPVSFSFGWGGGWRGGGWGGGWRGGGWHGGGSAGGWHGGGHR